MNTKRIFEQTKALIFGNMIQEYSKDLDFEYCYTKPSPSVYPFQYFWDTCFHVFILCAIGELKHAKMHLRSLFRLQKENGFIGNILYWNNFFPARASDFFQFKPSTLLKLNKPHMSSIIQPPFVAQALLRIHEKTKDAEYVRELLPGMKNYFRWLHDNRDFDGDGLISIITPFESGMDWKPSFDPALNFRGGRGNYRLFLKVATVDLRNFLNNYDHKTIAGKGYFRVKDAGYNSIYAKDLEALSELCSIVGDPEGPVFRKRSEEVCNSMQNLMFDPDNCAFFDLYGKENRKLKIATPTLFFPLIFPAISRDVKDSLIQKHWHRSNSFTTPFPLPSLSRNEPAFHPGQSIYIWRGPVWIFYNWFLHRHLLPEHWEFSEKLLKSSFELIIKSGFREYYDPFTGKGLGAKDFTWTGLITDMISTQKKRKEGFPDHRFDSSES